MMKTLVLSPHEDFAAVLRWMGTRTEWRDVTNIERTAPLRITAPAHGIPPDWPVTLDLPRHQGEDLCGKATVVSSNVIELGRVNGTNLRPYSGSGAFLKFLKPISLADTTVIAHFCRHGKDPISVDVMLELNTHRIRLFAPLDRFADFGRAFRLDVDAEDSSGRKIHIFSAEIERTTERSRSNALDPFVLFTCVAGEEGKAGTPGDTGVVRYDRPQNLAPAEIEQAQENLELTHMGLVNLYTAAKA
jgi:hypothetical protein